MMRTGVVDRQLCDVLARTGGALWHGVELVEQAPPVKLLAAMCMRTP